MPANWSLGCFGGAALPVSTKKPFRPQIVTQRLIDDTFCRTVFADAIDDTTEDTINQEDARERRISEDDIGDIREWLQAEAQLSWKIVRAREGGNRRHPSTNIRNVIGRRSLRTTQQV